MQILIYDYRNFGHTISAGLFSSIDVTLRAIVIARKLGYLISDVFVGNDNYGESGDNLFNKYIGAMHTGQSSHLIHALDLAEPYLYKDLSYEQHLVLREAGFFKSIFYHKLLACLVTDLNNCIGVHVRNNQGHIEPPDIDRYLFEVDKLLNSTVYGNANVFLATDCLANREIFLRRYNRKLRFNKGIYLPDTDSTIHTSWPKYAAKEKLVEDAFLDSLSLAFCLHRVYVGSNLLVFAAALKPGGTNYLIPTKTRDNNGGVSNLRKIRQRVVR